VRIIPVAVVAAAMLQQPPAAARPTPRLDARVTRVTAVASDVAFDNPVLHLKGVIAPTAGHRLQIVEIVIGQTPVSDELAAFRLVTGTGDTFAPIAVGGQADTLFPNAQLPLGHEISQILPSDAVVAVTRHGDASVTLEADSLATLALLYDIPRAAAVKSLRLPDGTLLPLTAIPQ
jgi:hypothetical protein